MKSKLIHILKKTGIVLVGLVVLLAAVIGFVFSFVLTPEKITPRVVQALNENLNAELSLNSVELTFFKTFPSFKLELEDGAVVKRMEVEQDSLDTSARDTLIQFEYAVVSVNPIAFFRDKIKVNRFSFENPKIYALVTPEGDVNWDILKPTDTVEMLADSIETKVEKEKFRATIDLQDISIVNGELIFDDRYSENYFKTRGFDLDLSANYNPETILLDLSVNSEDIVFRKKEGTFTDNLEFNLRTDMEVDRSSKAISIDEALLALNDLAFKVSGKMQPNTAEKEIDVDMDLSLEVPSLNTLIDLVPETIFDKTEKYKAGGEALITAKIDGIYKKGALPSIQSNLLIKNGSLSYDNKPNQVELIQVDADLYIPPDKGVESNFEIREMRLKAVGTDLEVSGTGKDLFNRGEMFLKFNGEIDMEALEKTFPLKKNVELEGRANMSISADFDLEDLKTQDYGRIQALGEMDVKGLSIRIPEESVNFKLGRMELITGQDLNSQLLTEKSTKVIGGKVVLSGLEFKHGTASKGRLGTFEATFASTPLRDTSQVATLTTSLLIDDGSLVLGDSVKARIKYLRGKLGLQPKKGAPKTPELTSDFLADSLGALYNSKKLALIKGRYKLKTTREGKNWPMEGRVSFGTLYAFTPAYPLELRIPNTEIVLKPGLIELDHAKLMVGKSDITATGRVYDIREAFLDDKMLKGELEVTSDLIDVNEMIYALNEGTAYRKQNQAQQTGPDEASPIEGPAAADDSTAKEEPRSFVVPANLDLRFQSRFKEVLYKKYSIKDVHGLITVKDQVLNLSALQMNTMAANMATTVVYTSKEKGQAFLGFDFKLFDIDLSKLTDLFPVIDSLLPMSQSFEGEVNFRMKGAANLDKSLGMVGPTLDAIARVEGDDLVILDGQTFQKIAKMLFFKNKERNTIDKLQFAMVFKDAMIEVFPSVITVDRYKVAIGGQHKLDMTYDYHISILKSPMPFKAGIDITGTEDDLDFKITKAKYKHLFSTKERQRKKADSTLIRRKIAVMDKLPFYE